MNHRAMRIALCALLLCASSVASACRSSSSGHVLVLGLDGMDPEVVDLLLSEGELPHFAKLRQQGAYGRLVSQKPLLSPVVWTSIATGKSPLDHGISHFVAVNPKNGAEIPVTSRMRRVKAVWNILSDAGQTVDVVGWWATWPAEPVHGAVVSDHTCYHFLFDAGAHGSADPAGVTHPPELLDEIKPLVRRPDDLTPSELARFVDVDAAALARPFDFQDDLSHFKWALATADSYRAIGLKLWKEQHPDVMLTYIEATDSTAHLFGHLFRAGPLSGELAEQQRHYGHAAEEMYRYADEIVGSYLDALGSDDTLIVLSDHGFLLGKLHDDPSETRDLRRVSERFHRMEGILYLYGNHVRAGRKLDRPSILDVAPTLLALRGVPPPADMPGQVLTEAVEVPAELAAVPRRVASYETPTPESASVADAAPTDVDAQVLDHLRALGYLDASSPKGDRNLAALRFESGDYAEAARLYAQLVKESPDDAGLHASYAGALGALGRTDESLSELTRAIEIDPANPEAYHNRGVIHEAKGERDAAIHEYETALQFAPDYEPSQRALARLRGDAPPAESATANEKLAAAMVERAREAAERGDYAGAMKTLDDAERVAPRFARIPHYRSNVAYLMGDRAGAIAALKRALELEPDNALFRTNLERLEKEPQHASVKPGSGARPH
ncbi:MAG TPA: alkaline phosphatase family protein [Myxococcota bacterium]|nr:alkaline phosphatase family protein [Myxococcota bacterium]